jgi:RNA polymerase sigma factor (sigma-70 family)
MIAAVDVHAVDEDQILQVLPDVARVAKRLHRSVSRYADLEDLISEGYVAVVRHASRFDPKKSAWKTFACLMAYKGMQDWLRDAGCSWFRGRRAKPRVSTVGSFAEGSCLPDDRNRDNDADVLFRVPEDRAGPGQFLHLRDAAEAVQRGLGDRERLALRLYFYGGLTMKEVGGRMGVSESRVSQIISGALAFMRQKTGGRRWEVV